MEVDSEQGNRTGIEWRLSALMVRMLHTRSEPELGRKLARDHLEGLCNEEELLGAGLFVWDWEVEDYVSVHLVWPRVEYRLKNRNVLELVREAANTRNSITTRKISVAKLERNDGDVHDFIATTVPLNVEGLRIGAIAMFAAKSIQESAKLASIKELFSCFLIAHQHLIRAQELQRVHDDLENRRAHFARLLEQLEERNATIERINLELRSSQEHIQRLATLGELSASVAHEINNPLAYVISCIDFIAKELDCLRTQGRCQEGDRQQNTAGLEGERMLELKESVASALEGAQRIRVIARDLTALSRNHGAESKLIDINDAIHTAVRILGPMLRNSIRLEMELGSGLLVMADTHQLAQVLVNLLANAVDAIRLQEYGRVDGLVQVRSFEENGRVAIEVRDNGPGVKESIAEKIMKPFFTTKPVGEGTGLGLSISQEIVKRFGGSLSKVNSTAKGACFLIELPGCR